MRFVTKIGATGLAGASALLLAVVPAQAATAGNGGHGGRVSGLEVLSGSVHGRAAISDSPTVPLRLRGLVNTFGAVNLGGPPNATHHSVFTFAGRIFVFTFNRTARQHTSVNRRNCYVVTKEREAFRVIGGTRVFWGASGPGRVSITFGAFVPRHRSGRCDVKAGPVTPHGAFIKFFAVITPLTIRVHHR